MRLSSLKSGKAYVDKLTALKSLVLSLSNTSPECLLDQKKILIRLVINFFAVLYYMVFDSGKTRS